MRSTQPAETVATHVAGGGGGEVGQAMEEERRNVLTPMHLKSFANDIGETVYEVDDNVISLAMTLCSIPNHKQTLFGAVLFSRGITGARVISSSTKATAIEGYDFVNFGSHSSEEHTGYLTVACGVGMCEAEVEELFARLASTYARFCRKNLGKEVRIANGTHGVSEDEEEQLERSGRRRYEEDEED